MNFSVQLERESDGRWIAEVTELPGVLVYGESAEQAQAKAQTLALRVLADRLEHGEAVPFESVSFRRHDHMAERSARGVLRALLRIGWTEKRNGGRISCGSFTSRLAGVRVVVS
jgi:predicted RNase H-like HicB family nuclease